MGPIRNPRWEQKRTEGYVIVSSKYMFLMSTNWTINTCVMGLRPLYFNDVDEDVEQTKEF
jgi:hypothetical protein